MSPNAETAAGEAATTKACTECQKQCTKDGFAKKQWKKPNRTCRLCCEYKAISADPQRACRDCRLTKPRLEFDVFQWGKGPGQSLCHTCREKYGEKIRDSLSNDGGAEHIQLADGTCVCSKHRLEHCDECMMSFTLPNRFARKRNELGRDLTTEEETAIIQDDFKDIRISRKICILDGQPVCPRTSKKLRCPCDEVTYCSEACQRHHWTIHKMTCKHHLEKKQKKAQKKLLKEKTKQEKEEQERSEAANSLTEEQKNRARREAFFAENGMGGEHSIEECAWQLCEHPLVIGGGSIRLGPDGEEFVKGDVAKIYRERMGVEWDGTPRFGLKPYVQKKPPVDWIAKARQGGKS